MPGHDILRKFFKDPEQFDRLSCVRCLLLMKDVVQPSCGHRLCQTCADDILCNDHPPLCPHKDCGEEFTDEDGANYFPDRFIRKEIQNLEVYCKFSSKGCTFEGKFSELEAHLRECKYASYECNLCGKSLALDQIKKHKAECENATQQCPLAKVGCLHDHPMSREVLSEHMSKNEIEHFTLLADKLHTLETTVKTSSPQADQSQSRDKKSTKRQAAGGSRMAADYDDPDEVLGLEDDDDPDEVLGFEDDGGYHTLHDPAVKRSSRANQHQGRDRKSTKGQRVGRRVVADCDGDSDVEYHTLLDTVERDAPNAPVVHSTKEEPMLMKCVPPKQKMDIRLEVEDPFAAMDSDVLHSRLERKLEQQVGSEVVKMRGDLQTFLMSELRAKTDEIASLRTTISKLERSVRSKHAESEDRDFRLSLIENSNHDGTMIWKIPQFSQRMSDAQNGKYTSIFSLPFYTSRYGYKMCMRLYILGDGIGKGTHMSLFFVLMKGEFDNILQWPFTHKVTFKLLNQAGGRDVLDTFQPDPMSSSFRKPRSDMNIASGCPRFVSQSDLKTNGFIVDDTIFIKCIIDSSTIRLP